MYGRLTDLSPYVLVAGWVGIQTGRLFTAKLKEFSTEGFLQLPK